jgi:hypothetical protein
MNTNQLTALLTADDAIAVCQKHRDLPIYLQSLVRLTPEAAAVLATHTYGITLNAIEELHPEVATALAPLQWGLVLRGLQIVSYESGEALADIGSLTLHTNTLRVLESPKLAARLARDERWNINLNSLVSLLPDVARAMVPNATPPKGYSLSLDSLRTITADTVRQLARTALTRLSLNGLENITSDLATALTTSKIEIVSLAGISDGRCVMSQGVVEILTASDTTLDVGGETGVAELFTRGVPTDFLAALVKSLEALNTHEDGESVDPYQIDLDDLKDITLDQAEAITSLGYRGSASLRGLSDLSPELIAMFVNSGADIYLDPDQITDVALAKKLADQVGDGGDLVVYNCKHLSVDAARALVISEVPMSFPKLASLSADLAAALRIAGELHLNGVTTLSADAATELSQHTYELHLNGLQTIAADVARVLVQHEDEIFLNGVTTLPHDSAVALSTRAETSRPLSLEGLRHAPPEAWEVLRGCPRIVLATPEV